MPGDRLAYVGSGECRVRMRVCRACLPEVSEGMITVPRSLVLLDAYAGLLGESIAGFLLGLVETSDERLENIAERYRFRVIAEELFSLVSDVGGLSGEMRLSPLYAPARRAHLLGEPYAGVYASSERDVEREYGRIAERVGLSRDGRVRPRIVRGALERARLRARLVMGRAGLRMGRVARRVAEAIIPYVARLGCGHGWEYDSRRYISLPEGEYWESSSSRVVSRVLGGDFECSDPGAFSSSLICGNPGGMRVVVKRYSSKGVKWVPASLASPTGARFTIRAPARLAREYVMLRVLRPVIPTPRILAVVRDPSGPVMIREYVEGVPVLRSASPDHWHLTGRALARIHLSGYALLDSNPGNFLVDNSGRVWLIDAEQARRFTPDSGAWDLLVFAAYSLLFKVERRLIVEALRGYREGAPDLFRELRDRAVSHRVSRRLMLVAFPLYSGARQILLSV